MFKLLRYFSIASAIAIIILTVALSFLYRENLIKNLTHVVERQNIALAQSFANTIWPKFGNFLSNASGGGDELRKSPEIQAIHSILKQLNKGLPILKIKIYSLKGLTVYSSLYSEIGKNKKGSLGFEAILKGKDAKSKRSFRKTFVAFGKTVTNRHLVETYLPIRDTEGNLQGVFELYTDVTPLFAEIRQQTVNSSLQTLFALVTLYIILFFIVKHANSLLSIQYRKLQNEIEDRKRAEEVVVDKTVELSERNAELTFQKKALDEHAIVSITDVKGNIIYANQKFCEISGYLNDELMGANHRIVKSEEHSPEFYKNLWSTISSGETWHGEIKNKKKNGQYYWVQTTIVPFLGKDGKPFQYVGIRTDITDEKEKEKALFEASKAAEAANKSKSEFLATMSHEIRTPINAFMGALGLLMDTPLDNQQRKYSTIAQSSAESLLVLINDILDFSKMEAGKIDFEHAPFDLSELLESVKEMLEPKVSDKGISFEINFNSSTPNFLYGDAGRLRQVLLNLVGNAIKFTDHGGVMINVLPESESMKEVTIKFEVIDSGIGISPENSHNLFTKFTTFAPPYTRKYGGTGLGLAISQKLVEMMKGKIDFDSHPGKGSRFWFEIRFVKLSSMDIYQISTKKINSIKLSHKKFSGRILLAEDSPTNQLVVKTILEKAGIIVDLASNGIEAIEAFERRDYDLILMDVGMPEMDGIEATKRIRQISREGIHTPVIAMTAHVLKGDREDLISAGMDDYLAKPASKSRILAMVDKWLESSKDLKDS